MDDKQQKILCSLQRRCIKCEYCRADVYSKALKAVEGDAELAAQLVDSLVQDGFVSDARYAAAFAREKSSLTGWGPAKIRFALSAKKISREDIDAALSEIDTEKASAKLQRLLEVKNKALEGDPARKLKLIKFALTRGYEYDTVKRFVDDLHD